MTPYSQRALVAYIATAQRAASQVIRAYSTSFYAATRLLGRKNRRHIRSIYALVRVADELVDGVGQAAGLTHETQRAALEDFEAATLAALQSGFSTDLVIQAFAHTARVCGINAELIPPFFASMRADLEVGAGSGGATYDERAHAEYVYGSAEVVGLMCLRVFLRGRVVGQHELAVMEHGARQLGAALQNINFLRDIGADTRHLGRHYLGTINQLKPAEKDHWVQVARGQLVDAEAAIALLPAEARRAVAAVHALFSELLTRIDRIDCIRLQRERVRVPDPVKAKILARSLIFDPASAGE